MTYFTLTRNYRCAKCGEIHFDFTGRRRVMVGKYPRWICAACAAKRKARCVEQRANV